MPVANNLHLYSAACHAATRLKMVKNPEYVVGKERTEVKTNYS